MKTAISIPDGLFEQAEREAARLGLSRSGLIARALAEFLERGRPSAVTERLNAILPEAPAGVDPGLAAMQWASLPPGAW